uniref:Transmembrane protein n=1 Tax=Helianthus annuus TaxID=4232 RepID=A0A251UML6_HELAN
MTGYKYEQLIIILNWMFIVVSSVDSWGLLFCCRYGHMMDLLQVSYGALKSWKDGLESDAWIWKFMFLFQLLKQCFGLFWTCYVIFWNKGLCWIVGLFFC